MSLTLLWFAIFQSMVIGLTDGMLTNRHLHGGIEQKLHNGKLPLDLNVQHSPKFKAVKEEDGKIGSRISPANYPQAERGNVFDEYLVGPEKTAKRVADPYRALEDPEAEGTKKFVKQLNAISGPFLKAIPSQGQMRQKYT